MPVDLHADDVADLQQPLGKRLAHRADPGGGAGGDHVAGLERERLGQVGDLLVAVVDHLARAAVLAQLVVDPGLDPEASADRRTRRR